MNTFWIKPIAYLLLGTALAGSGFYYGWHMEYKKFEAYKQQIDVQHLVTTSIQSNITSNANQQAEEANKQVEIKYKTIIKEVPKYVYLDKTCTIPNGFVSMWNAASDYLSVPTASEAIDASPSDIKLSEVLLQHDSDSAKFYECVSQVKGLQDWIMQEENATKTTN